MVRRLARLVALLAGCSSLLAAGCSSPLFPVGQGHTGFLSDRAFEIEATVEGEAPLRDLGPWSSDPTRSPREQLAMEALRGLSRRLALDGTPLFLERSHIDLETRPVDGNRLYFQARIDGVIRDSEAPAGRDAYRDRPGLRFRWPAPAAHALRPRYEELTRAGVLRVGVVFGQMRPGSEEGEEENGGVEDEALWSRRAFEGWLRAVGFREDTDPARAGQRLWSRPGVITAQVEVRGPEEFPIEGRNEEGNGELRALIQRSAVVYVNGHTRLPVFGALQEAASYLPRRPRVLVLDTCWSYHDATRGVLDATDEAQVVSTDGRVVTGSVDSFRALLEGLLAGVEAPGGGASWVELLGVMNDLAEERSRERAGLVGERLEPPEVYGVSPGW